MKKEGGGRGEAGGEYGGSERKTPGQGDTKEGATPGPPPSGIGVLEGSEACAGPRYRSPPSGRLRDSNPDSLARVRAMGALEALVR